MSDLFHPYSWRIYYNDEVAEWLRRWTANPMGSARVGSNPILVDNFFQGNILIFVRLHPNTGKHHMPPWRNRLARSAVNRKVGGSSPPGGGIFLQIFPRKVEKILTLAGLEPAIP